MKQIIKRKIEPIKNGPHLFCQYKKVKMGLNKNIIIHFHGGPESSEMFEGRFLKFYEPLLENGTIYIAWNYSGSLKFGDAFQKKPWKNWKSTLEKEWNIGRKLILKEFNIPEKNWTLIGSSFGSIPASIGANSTKINKLILVSPLIDLNNQYLRAKQDTHQKNWFLKRFSKNDLRELNLFKILKDAQTNTSLICSGKDEVLDTTLAKKFVLELKLKKSCYLWVQKNASHSPKSLKAQTRRAELLTKIHLDQIN